VLLKQGLVLSPPSRQTTSSNEKTKSRQEGLKRESVAKARLFHQSLKKMAQGVDDQGLACPLPLDVKMVQLAKGKKKKECSYG
jgi:hypothetical protein